MRRVLAVGICALVLGFSALSAAQDWDPNGFADSLIGAEADYTAGRYEGARDKYADSRATLAEALAADAIPDDQLEDALRAREIIVYQLARSHQQLGECRQALEVYDELESLPELSDGMRSKLVLRRPEAHTCRARTALQEGELDDAADALDDADATFASASVEPTRAALGDEAAARLQGELDAAKADNDAARSEYRQGRYAAAESAARNGECVNAGAHLSAAGDNPPPEVQSSVDRCSTFDQYEPWLALGVAGLGGVLVLTAVIVEAGNADDGDAYAAARTECLDGNDALSCADAAELGEDIESQRITTGVLVGLGVACLAGGLTWYFLIDDGDETESLGLYPILTPETAGAGLTVTF